MGALKNLGKVPVYLFFRVFLSCLYIDLKNIRASKLLSLKRDLILLQRYPAEEKTLSGSTLVGGIVKIKVESLRQITSTIPSVLKKSHFDPHIRIKVTVSHCESFLFFYKQ